MEAHEGKQRWNDAAGCSGAGRKEMAATKASVSAASSDAAPVAGKATESGYSNIVKK